MSVFAGLSKIRAKAALTLAERGVPVFPCNAQKRPLTEHGFKDASRDPDQIRAWWRATPSALIGLPTGEASGVDALDLDRKKCDPDETLEDLQRECDAMFRGPRVRTQNHGYHQYFEHDPRVRLGAGRFREGVDWRGEGGYVIAPDGIQYHLVADGEIEPWPEKLLAMVLAAQGGVSAGPQLQVVGGTDLIYKPTTDELAQAIRGDQNWHEAQLKLIASWTQRYGITPEDWVRLAPLFQLPGYSIEQTIREIGASARGAYAKFAPSIPSAPQGDLEVVPFGKLQSRDPPSFQVAGVIPEKSFGYIYGKAATFKTFVTLDIALSIAFGRHWQGRPVKPGRVLYILGEGQGAFANRVRSWQAARGLDGQDCAFWTIFTAIQFTAPADIARLVSAVEGAGVNPDWIFIDTVARNFGSGDPDKTQDMTVFVNAVDAVRQRFNCGVFGVHHAGKDETKGARNSSVLQAAADFEIRAEREEGAPHVTLVNTKAKDWEEFPRMRLGTEQVAVVDERTGEEVVSLVISDNHELAPAVRGEPKGKNETLVFGILKDRGALSFGELATATRLDEGGLGRAIRNLVKKTVVTKSNSTPTVYFIAEEDQ